MEKDFDRTKSAGGQESTSDSDPQQHITIPVIEEQLVVGKQLVETGKLRVVKTVSEREEPLDIVLKHDEFNVERIPVNQYVETMPPAVRHEGDTMIFSILREELVVQKRIVLVEEVRVTRKQVEEHETRQVTLRKEEVTVERHGPPHT